ncbi:hypothetical protein Pyn_27177 [Prunus yedoensis var. nudiflora]|uniref:Cysteine-rich transmembrane domain-containing protein n=1 Tax=Prunus yedoensis var. nudiflora TaxID=2094558 RepID=A0A314XW61_PRUYE|nr:hypothetical protein Pyn_27177 [Prunus yedoensis var. nudiflora]
MGSSTNSAAAVAYPPPPQPYSTAPAPGPSYMQAPPPVGYPTRDASNPASAHHGPVETKSKGDGFWEECCATLCCCFCLGVSPQVSVQ